MPPPGKQRRAYPDPRPYAVLAFRMTQRTPVRFGYDSAIEALAASVEYLKAGYQVRLTERCVKWFAEQPEVDPEARAALMRDGQAAAFTGPPQIREGDR